MQNDEELADALSLVVLLPYDDAMHKRGLCHRVVFVRPSVCLSVRLSVTFVYSVETSQSINYKILTCLFL